MDAAKIHNQINADIAKVHEKMERMTQLLQSAHNLSNLYFKELNEAVKSATQGDIPIIRNDIKNILFRVVREKTNSYFINKHYF